MSKHELTAKIRELKKDAIKLAYMLLDRWLEVREYIPEEELRQALKICNRQYNQYNKLKTMLISQRVSIG